MAEIDDAPGVEEVEDNVDAEDDLEGEEPEEENFVNAGATEVKLFGKWSFDDIEVRDLSLNVCTQEYFSMFCSFEK
jgi:hypothetical protein